MKRILLGSLSALFLTGAAVPAVFAGEVALGGETSDRELLAQASPSNSIAFGSFVTTEQDHPTNGMARIYTENGKRYVEFDREFTTARGPAVEVLLYRGDEVPVNLPEDSYVTLGELQSFDGGQRYEIPANIDLDEFESVAIWCRQFNVTFGYAALDS